MQVWQVIKLRYFEVLERCAVAKQFLVNVLANSGQLEIASGNFRRISFFFFSSHSNSSLILK